MNNDLQTLARLGALVIAAMCYPLCGMTQSAALEVGMILEKSGEVVLTGAASETPVQAYSVLRAGTRLRVASNATARLVHNRGRLTYFVRGPAQVTITSNSLMVEPATAISSKVDSVPPVELTQPGGAPAGNKQSNTQAGGENLATSRAGLASAGIGLQTAQQQSSIPAAPPPMPSLSGKAADAARAAASVRAAETSATDAAKAAAAAAERAVADQKSAVVGIDRLEAQAARDRLAADAKAASERLASAELRAAAVPTAATAVQAATPAEPPAALYAKAVKLRDEGKMREAKLLLMQASRAGYGPASSLLASISESERNPTEAARWSRLAISQGQPGQPRQPTATLLP